MERTYSVEERNINSRDKSNLKFEPDFLLNTQVESRKRKEKIMMIV